MWEVLDKVLFPESMFVLEQHYIEKFNTMVPFGYNMTAGGEGTRKLSEEAKRKRLSSICERKLDELIRESDALMDACLEQQYFERQYGAMQ